MSKYFVVMRDKDKKNKEVKEFSSFQEALEFQKKKEEEGWEGELPIGNAESKEEFLETFTEYELDD